jgi:hypothetical protein
MSRTKGMRLYLMATARAASLAAIVCIGGAGALADAAARNDAAPGFTQRIDGLDLTGVWKMDDYVGTGAPLEKKMLRTLEGAEVPLQPWAADIYRARMADDKAGHPYASATAYCLPGGFPFMMRDTPYPFQIFQTPGQMVWLYQQNFIPRIVYMNGSHPDDPDPSFFGDAVGHWEGATLVVDTVGLTERATIDTIGMPHTEKLHVVERIRKIAPDRIEDVMTLDDPGTFTRAWSIRHSYTRQPPDRMAEYICENQHNTPVNGAPGYGR